MGKGWIRKKIRRLPQKGMDIFIEPKFRRKKYGTKFFLMLAREITNIGMDNEWVYLTARKNDKVAISFINSVVYADQIFKIGNKIIYLEILIEE